MANIPPNADVWEYSEEEDEGYDYMYEPELTLSSIAKSKTINFSIHANYTKWEPREAFRELVQNWRDGIIKSFDLVEREFCVVAEKRTSGSDTEIVYKVPRLGSDDRKEWLGYIRYKGRNGEGTIDITNRSATLQPWHLDLGGTSKADDDDQAGAHGEGLKLALIVLMRGMQNHGVRCRSGGFNWGFNFSTRGRLVARLHRMSPEAIQRAEDQSRRLSQRMLLPFGSSPELDVQFVIGERHAGRDQWGAKVKRSPVKQTDFEAWTKAALFLQDARDGAIFSTVRGDLLTDPRLCGHIYLKGLLLDESVPTRSASITNKPLRFGYNFAYGDTNRERQSVSSADEEADAILAIWSKALEAKPDLVSELSAVLNSTEPKYADVAGAERFMDFKTACRLKEYLVGSQFAGKWYYGSEDKNKNPRLDHIIQGLGCEGVQLADSYWAILHRNGLMRTAEEEEHRRFTTAPPVTAVAELETVFAESVRRLLRACVYACPKTNGIAIQFVQAGQLHLQLFYSEAERSFRVHERWLSIDGAIEELGLPDDLLHVDAVFHTVKRLFAEALEQLPCELFVEEDGSRTAEWRRKLEVSRAEQRLLNYLRMEKLDITEWWSGCAMMVEFNLDPRLSRDTIVEIQCHSASRCLHLRESLLTAKDARDDKLVCITLRDEIDFEQRGSQVSACRSNTYHYSQRRHLEWNLDPSEGYFFVLLLPADPDSLVALSSVTGMAQRASLPSLKRLEPPSQAFHGPRMSAPGAVGDCSPYPLSSHRSSSADVSSADTSSSVRNGTDSNKGVPPAPKPDVNGKRPQPAKGAPGAKHPTVVPAPLPATATIPAPATAIVSALATTTVLPAGSFTLGPRLAALDVFTIDRERWYEAKNGENVQAVIGILNGEKPLPEETRKRPRID